MVNYKLCPQTLLACIYGGYQLQAVTKCMHFAVFLAISANMQLYTAPVAATFMQFSRIQISYHVLL